MSGFAEASARGPAPSARMIAQVCAPEAETSARIAATSRSARSIHEYAYRNNWPPKTNNGMAGARIAGVIEYGSALRSGCIRRGTCVFCPKMLTSKSDQKSTGYSNQRTIESVARSEKTAKFHERIGREKKRMGNMYDEAKTWNAFVGCEFDCLYCVPSFKAQARRQRRNCGLCYDYAPHFHEERLGRIPNSRIVFVCGCSDVSFAPEDALRKIIRTVRERGKPDQIFYFQSKRPECFEPYLGELPENAVLVTTLETNRAEGYPAVSKAPAPPVRFDQFKALDWPRKVLTLEPLLKFDCGELVEMVRGIDPEYVWLGLNSKRRAAALKALPEPSAEEFWKLRESLASFVDVRLKTIPEL